MIPTALLLTEPGPGAGWWQAPEHQTLARLAFARWWEGLPTAALVAARNSAPGIQLPVAAERHFAYRRRPTLSPALWFWLKHRHIRRVLLAGPDGEQLAAALARWGFDAAHLGAAAADGAPRPRALPWRIG